MNRKALYAAGGILLVGGAAVGTLLVLPGGSTFFDPGPPPPPVVVPLPPGAVAGPERGTGGSAIDLSKPGPMPTYEAPPPPPPVGSWEAVRPVARPSALGPVGAVVGRALLELKDQLDGCFDEDVQARHGRNAVTRTRDNAPIEDDSQTILMLQIETQRGSVWIVDAPIENQGPASDGLVACAQQVLRGVVIEAPGTKAGQRHRVLFTLTQ